MSTEKKMCQECCCNRLNAKLVVAVEALENSNEFTINILNHLGDITGFEHQKNHIAHFVNQALAWQDEALAEIRGEKLMHECDICQAPATRQCGFVSNDVCDTWLCANHHHAHETR